MPPRRRAYLAHVPRFCFRSIYSRVHVSVLFLLRYPDNASRNVILLPGRDIPFRRVSRALRTGRSSSRDPKGLQRVDSIGRLYQLSVSFNRLISRRARLSG